MPDYTQFTTPMCDIILVGDEAGLSNLHLVTDEGKRQFEIALEWRRNDEFFADIKTQILEYFHGERTQFDVQLNPKGTNFQRRVWSALCDIPFGTAATYKDVATAIGNSKASRAVGMANSHNPIPLIVPCHRVIGSSGKLVGFAHGLSIKGKLLRHEGVTTTSR